MIKPLPENYTGSTALEVVELKLEKVKLKVDELVKEVNVETRLNNMKFEEIDNRLDELEKLRAEDIREIYQGMAKLDNQHKEHTHNIRATSRYEKQEEIAKTSAPIIDKMKEVNTSSGVDRSCENCGNNPAEPTSDEDKWWCDKKGCYNYEQWEPKADSSQTTKSKCEHNYQQANDCQNRIIYVCLKCGDTIFHKPKDKEPVTVTLPIPNTAGQTVTIKAGEEKVFVTMSTGKDKLEWVEQDKEMSTTTSGTKSECGHEWLWNHSFNGAFEDKYVCKKCGEIIRSKDKDTIIKALIDITNKAVKSSMGTIAEVKLLKDKEPVDKEYSKDTAAWALFVENKELLAVINDVYELAKDNNKGLCSASSACETIRSKLEKYVGKK